MTSYSFGVHALGEKILTALLSKEKGKIVITSLKTFSKEENVKQFYTEEFKNPSYSCTTSLPSEEILFRKMHLPVKTKRQATQAIPFQLENLLPLPVDQMIVSLFLKKAPANTWDASVFCVKESCLETHLTSYGGLNPDQVILEPLALYRFVRFFYPEEKNLCVFLPKAHESLCLFIQDGEILFTHTVPGQDLQRLQKFLDSKGLLHTETSCLVLSASESFLTSWKETFSNPLIPPRIDSMDYAIAIGNALSKLQEDTYTLNLREGKWACERHHLVRKKTLGVFGSLAFAASFLLMLSSHFFFHFQYQKLKNSMSAIAPNVFFEDAKASPDGIRKSLREWEKTISSQKLPFPFFSTVPSAADVLAWLSMHPALVSKEGVAKEGIAIQRIHYHLDRYPKLGVNKDPYLARVEIELIAQTPKLAREFHDALLAGDHIVNAKKEIGWNVQQSTYTTSFEIASYPGKSA